MQRRDMHQLLLLAAKIKTLGDMQQVFEEMKSQGITRGSMEFVIDRVWWE